MQMNVMDFYDRALTGKRVTEQEFDMKLLPAKLKELIGRYEIKRDPNEVVPQDLDMAKRVFDAAVDLLVELGIYCKDTKSIIPVTKEDVFSALKNAPARHTIGEGNEAVECYARQIGDKRRPRHIGGANGAPLSEQNYTNIMLSCAREQVDGLHSGTLQTIFGRTVRANEPVELMACQYEALWTREAVRRAGKPGMCLLGIMSGVSSEVQDAGDFPGGLRPSDIHLVAFSNELKVNWQDIKKIIHNQNLGNIIESCCLPMLGGYCGGPEGTAITLVAEAIQGFVMTRSMSFATVSLSLRYGASDRQAIWVNCMLPLACISAGWNLLLAYYIIANADPCTEMVCEEFAAQIIALTASGISYLYGGGGAQIAKMDYLTGMESRICSEILQAASGLDIEKANEMVKVLVDGYEETLKGGKAPTGKSFNECYQSGLKPSSEYVSIWENKKKELERLGLTFK